MNRKNILFIARWYPDKHDPMLGLFVRAHAEAIKLYNNVTVLYITTDTNLPKDKVEVNINDFKGIKEVRIYFGKHAWSIVNFYRFLKYYLKGIQIAERQSGGFDLSHVHILSRCAIPAIYLKITKGIPYIITEHWSRYLPVNLKKGAYRGLIRKLFTRFAVSSAECVTTVTKNLADAMKNLGLNSKYHIIPNVADTSLFHPSAQTDYPENKKLIHVSCFDEPAKNIKGIINAVNHLAVTRSDFTLEIVGTGIDYDEVYAHAVKTGLVDSRIFFTGMLTGETLASAMRSAVALVMFSNYENLPCTIVESICSGVPVISTDVGGISEHITKKSGILVNTQDEPALVNSLNQILDNPLLFDKEAISNYGLKHFSMNTIGQQFNQIYLEILSK